MRRPGGNGKRTPCLLFAFILAQDVQTPRALRQTSSISKPALGGSARISSLDTLHPQADVVSEGATRSSHLLLPHANSFVIEQTKGDWAGLCPCPDSSRVFCQYAAGHNAKTALVYDQKFRSVSV